MERIADTAWEELAAAASRAQVPVVYCNSLDGDPVPVVDGRCLGCGEQLPWVVPLEAGSP